MLFTALLGVLLLAAPDTTPRDTTPPGPAPRGAVVRTSTLPAPPMRPLRAGTVADSLVLVKSLRLLILYVDGTAARTYRVALGQDPLGPKRFQGDKRTPEGLYQIDARNPDSRYHLSLHISYPNAVDRARASLYGKLAGGDVMIHGLPQGDEDLGIEHTQNDWTDGCVAVTDHEIEELWRTVPVGTPIDIKP